MCLYTADAERRRIGRSSTKSCAGTGFRAVLCLQPVHCLVGRALAPFAVHDGTRDAYSTPRGVAFSTPLRSRHSGAATAPVWSGRDAVHCTWHPLGERLRGEFYPARGPIPEPREARELADRPAAAAGLKRGILPRPATQLAEVRNSDRVRGRLTGGVPRRDPVCCWSEAVRRTEAAHRNLTRLFITPGTKFGV